MQKFCTRNFTLFSFTSNAYMHHITGICKFYNETFVSYGIDTYQVLFPLFLPPYIQYQLPISPSLLQDHLYYSEIIYKIIYLWNFLYIHNSMHLDVQAFDRCYHPISFPQTFSFLSGLHYSPVVVLHFQ